MSKPIPISVSAVRKHQAFAALLLIAFGIGLLFIGKRLGLSVWWLAAFWVCVGLLIGYSLRYIAKALVCPSCGFPLDQTAAAVERYGGALHSCPACGHHFGEDAPNHSLKADVPDGPRP